MKKNNLLSSSIVIALVILACLIPRAVFAASCLSYDKTTDMKVLHVPTSTEWNRAGQGLFGANSLYHVEDDIFWQKPQPKKNIKQAHISTLRFPGGELADNYDWEKSALERPRDWPGEAGTRAEQELRTDYKEFLMHAREAGVQNVFFVVNVDGAFRTPGNVVDNLNHYAEKAARWVKAVKEAGYHVPYWEIGNEPYLGAGFPLSTMEYSQALKIFAKAMRAVDPTIKIGAAGPGGVESVGFADRIGGEGLRSLRTSGGNIKKTCGDLSREDCIEKIENNTNDSKPSQAWWPTLITEAAGSFDFAVIHRYDYAKMGGGKFPHTKKLQNLKTYLQQSTGRTIPLALTEWNTPNEKKHKPLTELDHLLEIAIQLGNNVVGGVDFAHYWPMRIPSGAFKPLLTYDGELTSLGRLFSLYSELITDADVSQSLLDKNVYLLRMRRVGENGYIIVNASLKDIQLELNNASGNRVLVSKLTGNPEGKVLPAVECTENALSAKLVGVDVPRKSITIIRVFH